ncbi:MAG: hypothetical protein MUF72_14780 [Elainella sp. Prado103]|nr:hypothetical protein [Elainella sp. Prado103]
MNQPLHPLAQEGYISQRLKESGYVMSKINLITWQIAEVRTGLTYALTIRDQAFYCLPLHGSEQGASTIQTLVRAALQESARLDRSHLH